MKVLYISEVQWLSQASRKHLLVRRFPREWDILFLSPINAVGGENSFRVRRDSTYPHVRYVSLPLPKPESYSPLARAMTGPLLVIGTRRILAAVRRFRPDIVVCSFIWAAPAVHTIRELGIPVVYDLNDLHPEFYPDRKAEAERMFRTLIDAADEVVASSRHLREIAGRGIVIGNGVDLEVFRGKHACPVPAPLAASPLSRSNALVAYVGSIDDRFDFAILDATLESVRELPGVVGVVCVGRVYDSVRDLRENTERKYGARVLFAGLAEYEELPAYLSHASVGIAPFRLTARTRAINPNKLYMYAAMDMNIVSTPFSNEIEDYGDLVYIAAEPQAFARCVIDALGGDERRRAVRERIALPNSWDRKAFEFTQLLLRVTGRG